MNITDKIKTFQDACDALGIGSQKALPELLQPDYASIVPPHIVALLKLEIITKALNEGWQWIPDRDTMTFWPWFWLYTNNEIESMSDMEKEKIGLISAKDVSGYYSGLGYADSNTAWSYSYAHIGSRLAYKSEELAKYSGRQFIDIWKDYLFIKK